MLYRVHLAWAGFELVTLVVIGTDCTGSCRSNYQRSRRRRSFSTIRLMKWLCYCTVHAYVDIHFFDSMWSSWAKANLCMFLSSVYICSGALEPQFNPATFVACSKPEFPTSYVMVLFCSCSEFRSRGSDERRWFALLILVELMTV